MDPEKDSGVEMMRSGFSPWIVDEENKEHPSILIHHSKFFILNSIPPPPFFISYPSLSGIRP